MENFNHVLGFEWENLETILDTNYDASSEYRVHTSRGDVCYTIRSTAPDSTVYGAECEGRSDIYVDAGEAPNFYLRSLDTKNILEISEVS